MEFMYGIWQTEKERLQKEISRSKKVADKATKKYWNTYSESAAADLIWHYLDRCKFKAALAFM
jgi:hypothetical protein